MVNIDFEHLLVDTPIAIAPYYRDRYESIIYTHQGSYQSVSKVEELLNYYCMIHGSDLRGRLNAVRTKLGIKKYPPILVSPTTAALQVPSACRQGMIWIFEFDFLVKSRGQRESTIIIKDYIELPVRWSKRTVRLKRAQAMEVLMSFR